MATNNRKQKIFSFKHVLILSFCATLYSVVVFLPNIVKVSVTFISFLHSKMKTERRVINDFICALIMLFNRNKIKIILVVSKFRG